MGAKPQLNEEQKERADKILAKDATVETQTRNALTDAVASGFEFETMAKLEEGQHITGVYKGMTDEVFKDPTDPDAKPKDVKVVRVETQPGVTVRMLGNSQVINELARAKEGDTIYIVRQPGQRNTRRGRRVHLFAVGIKPA